MGLFGGGNAFHVNLDGVELSYPEKVAVGDGYSVDVTVNTGGQSDDYYIEDIQLYLETEAGTRILGSQKEYNPRGGAIPREPEFTFAVDGEMMNGFVREGHIEPGSAYSFGTHIIFTDLEEERVETYWEDDAGDGIRFV